MVEQLGSVWAAALCPLHDDTSESLTVNMEEGGWRCHAGCGSSWDLAVLVAEATDEDLRDVRRRLRQRMPSSPEALARVLAEPRSSTGGVVEQDLFYERGKAPRYIFDRGFTADTLRAWEVGQDTALGAVVIPVHVDGVLVGLVRRRVHGEPRYVNTPFPKGGTLLGLDHVPFGVTRVVVVEGPLDAMWLYQCRVPAVALLGSSMSSEQAGMLAARFWEVVLAFDADVAGVRGAWEAARLLGRVGVLYVELPPGRKDVQECTAEEVATVFADGALTRWR